MLLAINDSYAIGAACAIGVTSGLAHRKPCLDICAMQVSILEEICILLRCSGSGARMLLAESEFGGAYD